MLFAVLIFVFAGCNSNADEYASTSDSENVVTLWIVSESSVNLAFDARLSEAVKQYERSHSNVTVQLELLPSEEQERSVRLEQIRTEILAGNGPDAYLMEARGDKKQPLFADVTQSMYNGLFFDISEFYNTDTMLKTDSLNLAVMEAGTLEEARYVLPLWFNYPVFYVDATKWEAALLNDMIFEEGILCVMDAVNELEDNGWACGTDLNNYLYGFNMYSELMDYKSASVKVNADAVASYLKRYQVLRELIGDTYSHRTSIGASAYVALGEYWGNLGFPMYCGSISDCIGITATSKSEGKAVNMYPVRGVNGKLVADIIAWGAVGAGSNYPELAYEFIRQFLTEEFQWGSYLEDTGNNLWVLENALPVRTVGATQGIWEKYKEYLANIEYVGSGKKGKERKKKLMSVELMDSDIPILEESIYSARFPIANEVFYCLNIVYRLNDVITGEINTDADINALAQDTIRGLEWHLAEG